MRKELIQTGGVKSAGGRPYSPGLKVGEAIFLSGQVPIDPEGRTVGKGDPGAQWRRCLDNIRELLEAAGAKMDDIVFLSIYVTDMAVYLDHGAVREAYFAKPYPASTVIGVTALANPEWLIEIEATAIRGAGEGL